MRLTTGLSVVTVSPSEMSRAWMNSMSPAKVLGMRRLEARKLSWNKVRVVLGLPDQRPRGYCVSVVWIMPKAKKSCFTEI